VPPVNWTIQEKEENKPDEGAATGAFPAPSLAGVVGSLPNRLFRLPVADAPPNRVLAGAAGPPVTDVETAGVPLSGAVVLRTAGVVAADANIFFAAVELLVFAAGPPNALLFAVVPLAPGVDPPNKPPVTPDPLEAPVAPVTELPEIPVGLAGGVEKRPPPDPADDAPTPDPDPNILLDPPAAGVGVPGLPNPLKRVPDEC
jgi:hypothetical protein